MTVTETEDWTPIPLWESPSMPFPPSQPSSTSPALRTGNPTPAKDGGTQAEEQPSSKDSAGFLGQHRTVAERFRALFPCKPDKEPVENALCESIGAAAACSFIIGIFYLYAWLTGSAIKPPSSFAELMAFNAVLWRWSRVVATYSVWCLQVFTEGFKLFVTLGAYIWSFVAVAAFILLGAFLGAQAVVPPILFVTWSVNLHEWSIQKLLPSNLVSPPIAYAFDHLLLISPVLLLARYIPAFLAPFTHPLLVYPLLTLYIASAALDCTIPEVFNYPFDRFERILAEQFRQLQEHEDKRGEAEGKVDIKQNASTGRQGYAA